MMLLTKALLILKMLTAASAGPVAYEPCTDIPGVEACADGFMCNEGTCTPAFSCKQDSECPAGPDGNPAVCELSAYDGGVGGLCQVAPGPDGGCPDGFTPDKGMDACIDICVR